MGLRKGVLVCINNQVEGWALETERRMWKVIVKEKGEYMQGKSLLECTPKSMWLGWVSV